MTEEEKEALNNCTGTEEKAKDFYDYCIEERKKFVDELSRKKFQDNFGV